MSAYARYSFRLYTLSIIRKDLTRKAAVAIVKSMLMPYFDYMLFLYNSCTDKFKTKAQCLVNRSLRVALGTDSQTSVNSLHDQTAIMKLDIRARFNVLKMMHFKVYVTKHGKT